MILQKSKRPLQILIFFLIITLLALNSYSKTGENCSTTSQITKSRLSPLLFIDSIKSEITSNIFSTQIYKYSNFKSKYKDYKNVILVDLDSNKILFEKDAYEMVEIASITKMMSILIIMEDIEKGIISLTDTLIASRASSIIGGSQIYLKEKEKMDVENLLKSVIIKSANDATFLFAETLAEDGQISTFIKRMNETAKRIGMNNTIFYYPHGLPPSWADRKKKKIPGNLSTCYDLTLLTKELLKYPKVTEYSSIWLDSVRTGPGQKPFQLRNTSRLIKDYKYFDGLKTGFYNRAGFCIVATAMKEERRLVAVVLGSRNQKRRNWFTRDLVYWGYSEIELAKLKELEKKLEKEKFSKLNENLKNND